MSGVHAKVHATDSRVEVDYFRNHREDDEIFLEVHDSSTTDGRDLSACAILSPPQALELARALTEAAKAASA
jgi:hypothetical protein